MEHSPQAAPQHATSGETRPAEHSACGDGGGNDGGGGGASCGGEVGSGGRDTVSAGACAGGWLPRGALLDALLVAFSTQPTSECVAHALPFLWILYSQQRNLPPGSELQPTVPDTAHSPQEAAQHAPSAEMSPAEHSVFRSTQPTSAGRTHALPFLWILDAQHRNRPPGSELQPVVPDMEHSPQDAAQHAPSR